MVISPTFPFSRTISSSRSSRGRSDKPAGAVVPSSVIPSIRLSFLCGPFNRSRISQPTLMHTGNVIAT
jgi:hypothetical protein